MARHTPVWSPPASVWSAPAPYDPWVMLMLMLMVMLMVVIVPALYEQAQLCMIGRHASMACSC